MSIALLLVFFIVLITFAPPDSAKPNVPNNITESINWSLLGNSCSIIAPDPSKPVTLNASFDKNLFPKLPNLKAEPNCIASLAPALTPSLVYISQNSDQLWTLPSCNIFKYVSLIEPAKKPDPAAVPVLPARPTVIRFVSKAPVKYTGKSFVITPRFWIFLSTIPVSLKGSAT